MTMQPSSKRAQAAAQPPLAKPGAAGHARPPAAAGSRLRPWLFAVAGFFFGVVFWHAVGFWAFVSEAVFSGPRSQIARDGHAPRHVAAPVETGSISSGSFDGRPPHAAAPNARNAMSPVRATPFDRRNVTPPVAAVAPPTPVHAATPPGVSALPTGTLNCADLVLAGATPADLAASGCQPASAPTTNTAANAPDAALDSIKKALAETPAASDGVPPLPPRIGAWSTAVQSND